jgi:hypothetical protein
VPLATNRSDPPRLSSSRRIRAELTRATSVSVFSSFNPVQSGGTHWRSYLPLHPSSSYQCAPSDSLARRRPPRHVTAMSYQNGHDRMDIPDYADTSADYFEGKEEQSPIVDDAASQLQTINQIRQLAASHQSLNHASSHGLPQASAPPTEYDSLLAPPATRSLGRESHRGGVSLPADYPSPLQDHPIATGSDAFGAFEVFPPSIHPAGRHYHKFKTGSGTDVNTAYRPCPPCVTTDTAHQSTESFTLPGWLLGICCFPCGIICCCFMTKKSCARCGAKLEP